MTCGKECAKILREATIENRHLTRENKKVHKSDAGKIEREARKKGLRYADIQKAETLAMIGRINTEIEPVKKGFIIYD